MRENVSCDRAAFLLLLVDAGASYQATAPSQGLVPVFFAEHSTLFQYWDYVIDEALKPRRINIVDDIGSVRRALCGPKVDRICELLGHADNVTMSDA
ncbi:hypothetical protein IY145_02730 [Methylosinus sp. H3A]|uniref:hypothetical protein n=1 Tax=Methylosinus sp. H3A TaxID=2785786 RepID=UPI0018C224E0|nr:hypothetical protein [Methylosinus sp. H3A]MBG0808292.1 hypothetical protein [Methylosinus sp. H3A]